jgi:hypothetical protein
MGVGGTFTAPEHPQVKLARYVALCQQALHEQHLR